MKPRGNHRSNSFVCSSDRVVTVEENELTGARCTRSTATHDRSTSAVPFMPIGTRIDRDAGTEARSPVKRGTKRERSVRDERACFWEQHCYSGCKTAQPWDAVRSYRRSTATEISRRYLPFSLLVSLSRSAARFIAASLPFYLPLHFLPFIFIRVIRYLWREAGDRRRGTETRGSGASGGSAPVCVRGGRTERGREKERRAVGPRRGAEKKACTVTRKNGKVEGNRSRRMRIDARS